jgi:4-hydroxy-4-methyl-2-oxoglutarate aldolase
MYTSEFLSKCPFGSAILSDTCDDLNISVQIFPKEFKANFIDARVSGLAKTINVIKYEKLDSRLYDSLKIFESLDPKDIIIVANEQQDLAFWGELNTRLGLRSGVQGAIIGSPTRDSEYTAKCNFPVFSIGNTPKDVKGRAIVESINKSIVIKDITINYKDWILGDRDGIIVIPSKEIERVYNYANKVFHKERDIIKDIDLGVSALEIYRKYGEF